MEPHAIARKLNVFGDSAISDMLIQLLQDRPELAPGVVRICVPEICYPPAKALTGRRCSGKIKIVNGLGFIESSQVRSIFGCDASVTPQQVGAFLPGQEVNFAVALNSDNKPQAYDLLEHINEVMKMKAISAMMGVEVVPPPTTKGKGKAVPPPKVVPPAKVVPPPNRLVTSSPSGISSAGAKMMDWTAMGGMVGMDAVGTMVGGDIMGGCCIGAGLGGMDLICNMGMDGIAQLDGTGCMDGMGCMGGLHDGCMASMGMGAPSGLAATMNDQVLGDFFGVLKSFNTEKFFGFIVSEGLIGFEGDVFVSGRHLAGVKVGQEVKFQAFIENGRLQARNVRDATGLVGPQKGIVPGMGEEQVMGRFVGQICAFHHDKGFGFIKCDVLSLQGYPREIFLHERYRNNFDVGDSVAFSAVMRNGRFQAKDLQDASMALQATPMASMNPLMPLEKKARLY